jgi:DNA-binding LacI/PurR family transcriptional regulator
MTPKSQRITQRSIAELAGVSQATVSLVLNGKADATTRIPEETRRRVLEVIKKTTYVADPAARRLAGVGNNILGVFTYESAFPKESVDFYTPLLTGIEAQAEQLGCDLLMFTSAPVVDGHRQIFHENNRLRLADGCLLLGRDMDADELERLVDSGFPFVAIGRREAAGGRVPYVGADYATPTAALVRRAREAGHRRFAYLALPNRAESGRDRERGVRSELDAAGIEFSMHVASDADLENAWRDIHSEDPSVLIVEDPTQAGRVHALAAAEGVRVPEDLSMIVLGELARPDADSVDFTRLSPPRTELGAKAVALLNQILSEGDGPLPMQMLLDCDLVGGTTLGAPAQ